MKQTVRLRVRMTDLTGEAEMAGKRRWPGITITTAWAGFNSLSLDNWEPEGLEQCLIPDDSSACLAIVN